MIKLFLHTTERIRIVNGAEEYTCTPDEFAVLEPDYPGLPQGCALRYWTPEVQRFDAAAYDDHDCLTYINKCATYTPTIPVVSVSVTLSQTFLNITADPAESITFHAEIQAPAPIDYTWYIPLRHENGDALDRIEVNFVASIADESWNYRDGLPLGWWEVREEDFDLIELGGDQYQPRLTAPVKYCLFRDQ